MIYAILVQGKHKGWFCATTNASARDTVKMLFKKRR